MISIKVPSRNRITNTFPIIVKKPKRSAIVITTYIRKDKCILWRQLCIFSFNPIIMAARIIIVIVFIYFWIILTIPICVIKYMS